MGLQSCFGLLRQTRVQDSIRALRVDAGESTVAPTRAPEERECDWSRKVDFAVVPDAYTNKVGGHWRDIFPCLYRLPPLSVTTPVTPQVVRCNTRGRSSGMRTTATAMPVINAVFAATLFISDATGRRRDGEDVKMRVMIQASELMGVRCRYFKVPANALEQGGNSRTAKVLLDPATSRWRHWTASGLTLSH